MTNEEIMEAFAKNAAEIVRLERENERLCGVLESGRVALGMLHRAIRECDPASEISVRIRDIIVSLK